MGKAHIKIFMEKKNLVLTHSRRMVNYKALRGRETTTSIFASFLLIIWSRAQQSRQRGTLRGKISRPDQFHIGMPALAAPSAPWTLRAL